MRLSELHSLIDAAGDVHAFTAYLAAPDKDGVDVDLASVGRVDVDYDKGEVRLYPASTATDVDSIEPEPFFGMVLDQLPTYDREESDLRVLIEVPLLRDESGGGEVRLVDLAGFHVGTGAEEVWLLARPAGEFAAGLLPE
ncbi:MAG TPA: hypothetical protein VMB48_17690 [Steroidobacteraceae bacterium]|nr:hypothetical protein [Steroidobacteraceae bacterium]